MARMFSPPHTGPSSNKKETPGNEKKQEAPQNPTRGRQKGEDAKQE